MRSASYRDLLLGLAAGSLALLVFTGKFGYFFGQGDQDEFIPYLLRLIEPGLYSADWFINQQVEYFNVRTYFVWSVYPFASFLGPSLAIKIFYSFSFISISVAIYFLAMEILKNRTLSLLAPIAALSLTHKWTLGSNDLVYSMMVPEMLSWSFAIWAMRQVVRKSTISAGVLLGVASWFQVLVGVQSAFIWALVLVFQFAQKKSSFQEVVGFVVAVTLFSLPSTGPIVLSLLNESLVDKDNLFYILAAFRNPFHHLFFSFAWGSVVKFFLLFGCGMLAWLLFLRGRDYEHLQSLLLFVGFTLIVLILNLVLTEVTPILFIAKLQWFKLTVLIKMLMLVFILGAIKQLASRYFTTPKFWTRESTWHLITAFSVVIVSSILWVGLTNKYTERSSALTEVETWVENGTSLGGLFIVPPSISSFRTNAKRSVYINYASFPYRDPDMIVWFERMQEMAPVGRPERGVGIKPNLDSAFYQNMTGEKAKELGGQYVLLEKAQSVHSLEANIVFENDDWALHQLESSP